jgi:hypothetical protein
MTARESETLFYDLLARNSHLPVKELCRKIPRKMVYKYLSRLKGLQDATGIEIFTRAASICQVTGLPNIVIERKCQIEITQMRESMAVVTLR